MERNESVLTTVARVLGEVFPDVEIVDRDLSVGRERSLQLAAVDGGGRLLIVLIVDEPSDEVALLALDALAFARRNVVVLAGHFRCARLRPELAPLLVVVARRFDETFAGRLGALDPRCVRAFELRRVVSARGSADYLAEIDPAGAAPHRERAAEPAGFLEALDAAHRELGELLLRRIARLDHELEAVRRGGGIDWRLHDDLVCSVSARDGAIAGQVPGHPPLSGIGTRGEAEHFLAGAVQRYLALARGKPAASARVQGEFGREPLLTPEELAAFEPTK